ncbi:UNVERIFIED_CONTAM: rubrerythrin [Acetivibrio alkalicellulosi]
MDKIKDILKFAMRMEKDAQDFYSYYMDRVQTEPVRKLFEELVQMEKDHYNILKKKFDQLEYQEPPITISWVVDNSFTSQDPSILSLNSELIDEDEKEMSDLSIVRLAYLMESDFALFYKNAADEVEDIKAKEFLKELAKWEEGHKNLFHRKYEEMIKKHWRNVKTIIFDK